jgi:hypothetical protein
MPAGRFARQVIPKHASAPDAHDLNRAGGESHSPPVVFVQLCALVMP